MGRRRLTALLLCLSASACSNEAPATDASSPAVGARAETGEVTISSVRVLDPRGSDRTSLYAVLVNGTAEADTLLGIEAEAADEGSLHEMTMEGGMMSMNPLESIPLPAGGTVELSPGALHGMLEGLANEWIVGDSVSVTLRFAKAGPRTVWATIRDPADAHSTH